jgi:hypothetical protein
VSGVIPAYYFIIVIGQISGCYVWNDNRIFTTTEQKAAQAILFADTTLLHTSKGQKNNLKIWQVIYL